MYMTLVSYICIADSKRDPLRHEATKAVATLSNSLTQELKSHNKNINHYLLDILGHNLTKLLESVHFKTFPVDLSVSDVSLTDLPSLHLLPRTCALTAVSDPTGAASVPADLPTVRR